LDKFRDTDEYKSLLYCANMRERYLFLFKIGFLIFGILVSTICIVFTDMPIFMAFLFGLLIPCCVFLTKYTFIAKARDALKALKSGAYKSAEVVMKEYDTDYGAEFIVKINKKLQFEVKTRLQDLRLHNLEKYNNHIARAYIADNNDNEVALRAIVIEDRKRGREILVWDFLYRLLNEEKYN
jgi:hypothetical protein